MQQKKPSNQFLDDLITRRISMFTVSGNEIVEFTLLSYDQYNYIVSDLNGKQHLFHKHAIESICEA